MNWYLRFIVLLFVLLLGNSSSGQTYYVGNGFSNGATVNTCSGLFKDSNPFGNYNADETYTVTFCSSTPGKAIDIVFDTLNIGIGDTLWVYDGNSVTAPLINFYTNINVGTSVRATVGNVGGCITLKFVSNLTDQASGWSAMISCKSPCQKVEADIFSTTPAFTVPGEVRICIGDEVTFRGRGIYAQNNQTYSQNDTVHTFNWSISDGFDTTNTFVHTIKRRFTTEGGYYVRLNIKDTNGCRNTIFTTVKVKTSIKPTFSITGNNAICAGDTAYLAGSSTAKPGSFSVIPTVADSLFLPDGAGVCYENNLSITQFAQGQVLSNINDLDAIIINMEHSYLGDVELKLTAPNGSSVMLKKTTGASGTWDTYLGEPVDEPSAGSPLATVRGKGYDYLFKTTPTYGTMPFERGKYRYSYTDNANQNVVNHFYLPSGSYASEDPLTALVGTPLNGIWTLRICDKFTVDNGFIFYWTIRFKSTLFPNPETYVSNPASYAWKPATDFINNGATAKAFPSTGGTYSYKFSVTDSFGCSYDTTVSLIVNPKPVKPDLGKDTTVCDGSSVQITVKNFQPGVTYTWNDGTASPTNILTQAGVYWVKATVAGSTCVSYDTIIVTYSNPDFTVSLGNDISYCATSALTINATAGGNTASITGYSWSNGSTGISLNVIAAGTYWVRAFNAVGCGIRDTIVISDNPINQFSLQTDTTLCPTQQFTIQLQPPAGTIITWQNGTSGNNFTVNNVGVYSIAANYLGCMRYDTLQVTANPLPIKPNLGADTIICANQTINLNVLNVIAGINYSWNTGATGSSLAVNNTGSYIVTATNNLTCTSGDTIVVNPQTAFSISLGNDTLFCKTQAYTVTAKTTGNIVSYLWQDNSTANSFTIPSVGLYWVEGRTVSGCRVRDTLIVTDNVVNSFQLPADTTICDFSSYTLNLQMPFGTTALWNDGVTGVSRVMNRADKYIATVNYKGCINIDSMIVGSRPLPIINLGKDTTLCLGFDLPLKVSYPGATYRWNTGSIDSFIVAKNTGLYWVEAFLNACTYRDSLIFDSKNCDCNVQLPNAFSPNGDGINDYYQANISCFPKAYRFTVFNRSGQSVFNSANYQERWDGTIKGKPAPVGTYYYILSFINESAAKQEQFTGYIVVLR